MNGVAIEPSSKYWVDPVRGELVVRRAEVEDEGIYECIAANPGSVSASAELIVKSKTQIIEGPSDQEATVFTSLKVSHTITQAVVLIRTEPILFRSGSWFSCPSGSTGCE